MFIDPHNPKPDYKPQRIISTVPSLTELLYDLECDDEVIGITKFCVHPNSWRFSKKNIGGTKNLRMNDIYLLAPDLIIANKEENTKEEIEQLAKDHTVLLTDIKNLSDTIDIIRYIGLIINRQEQASRIINSIEESKAKLQKIKNQHKTNFKICYLIWKDPYMSVGQDTFIHSMLAECGFINVFSDSDRYPQISLEQIQAMQPDYIFLSSEPYPFTEKHLQEFQGIKTTLVDGEAFSWYGSHIVKSFSYFCNLIPRLA